MTRVNPNLQFLWDQENLDTSFSTGEYTNNGKYPPIAFYSDYSPCDFGPFPISDENFCFILSILELKENRAFNFGLIVTAFMRLWGISQTFDGCETNYLFRFVFSNFKYNAINL